MLERAQMSKKHKVLQPFNLQKEQNHKSKRTRNDLPLSALCFLRFSLATARNTEIIAQISPFSH